MILKVNRFIMQILLFYFKDDELWSIFVVANLFGSAL
jgi:hypothetical protein